MLFKILKLFGLDVPAKLEAAKAILELRVERMTDQIRQAAQAASVIVVLSALAIVTSAMAVGVGLFALYRWTADAYGDYAAFGVVGGILFAAAAVLIAVTMIQARSLRTSGLKLRRAAGTTEAAWDTTAVQRTLAADADATTMHSDTYSWTAPTTAAFPVASASDLVEPLGFLLSKVVKFPTIGNPVIDELIGKLRVTAHGSTDEAIDGAADVIRHGNRTNLVVVLTGTAFLAWLLTHNSRQ
jgi:hypothetical protein